MSKASPRKRCERSCPWERENRLISLTRKQFETQYRLIFLIRNHFESRSKRRGIFLRDFQFNLNKKRDILFLIPSKFQIFINVRIEFVRRENRDAIRNCLSSFFSAPGSDERAHRQLQGETDHFHHLGDKRAISKRKEKKKCPMTIERSLGNHHSWAVIVEQGARVRRWQREQPRCPLVPEIQIRLVEFSLSR